MEQGIQLARVICLSQDGSPSWSPQSGKQPQRVTCIKTTHCTWAIEVRPEADFDGSGEQCDAWRCLLIHSSHDHGESKPPTTAPSSHNRAAKAGPQETASFSDVPDSADQSKDDGKGTDRHDNHTETESDLTSDEDSSSETDDDSADEDYQDSDTSFRPSKKFPRNKRITPPVRRSERNLSDSWPSDPPEPSQRSKDKVTTRIRPEKESQSPSPEPVLRKKPTQAKPSRLNCRRIKPSRSNCRRINSPQAQPPPEDPEPVRVQKRPSGGHTKQAVHLSNSPTDSSVRRASASASGEPVQYKVFRPSKTDSASPPASVYAPGAGVNGTKPSNDLRSMLRERSGRIPRVLKQAAHQPRSVSEGNSAALTPSDTIEKVALGDSADAGGERRPIRKAFSLDASSHSYSLEAGGNGRGPEDAPTRQARPFFATPPTDAVVKSPVSESTADTSATQMQTDGISDLSKTQLNMAGKDASHDETPVSPNGLVTCHTAISECSQSPEPVNDLDPEAATGSKDCDSSSEEDDLDSTEWLSDCSVNGSPAVADEHCGSRKDSDWIFFPKAAPEDFRRFSISVQRDATVV